MDDSRKYVNDRKYDEENLYKKHENKVNQELILATEIMMQRYCGLINENMKKRNTET
jgi:hypothetical protein